MAKLIFIAELNDETKKVEITIHSKHLPTLAYIKAYLDYEITELIAREKTENDIKNAPRIKIAGFEMGGIKQ